ncbi:unnamed protein product, partial [Pleuronectes platessa]
ASFGIPRIVIRTVHIKAVLVSLAANEGALGVLFARGYPERPTSLFTGFSVHMVSMSLFLVSLFFSGPRCPVSLFVLFSFLVAFSSSCPFFAQHAFLSVRLLAMATLDLLLLLLPLTSRSCTYACMMHLSAGPTPFSHLLCVHHKYSSIPTVNFVPDVGLSLGGCCQHVLHSSFRLYFFSSLITPFPALVGHHAPVPTAEAVCARRRGVVHSQGIDARWNRRPPIKRSGGAPAHLFPSSLSFFWRPLGEFTREAKAELKTLIHIHKPIVIVERRRG